MAIQYYMRAFNTTLSKYVDWVVNDTPDSTGAFSGFPTNQLINITVNRIVQSKVANFLKQNQSLGGTDGYFFHVNSYDWRNAVTPIPPPTNFTGFAVERGVASVSAITGATNASPIQITTAVNHGLATGQLVTINGVTGNVGANGTWPIVVNGLTTFTLTGSTGTGIYTSGGNVFIPSNFSTLIWDEINNVWRFVVNTNGDGTTLGVSQNLKVNNLITDGYIALGPDPADTGSIRLSNNTYIFSESNPTGTDVQLIGADLFNRIKLGVNTTDIVYDPGVLVVDGYIQHDGTSGNTSASTGFIREQNNTTILAFKNVNQNFSDITTLSSNTFNNIVIGDTVNTGTIHNTAFSTFSITAATAASPVQITVSAPTTFVTGQSVTISGITGTIGTDPTNGLNGKTFSIAVLNSTQFTLTGSNGTGLVYTSGGLVTTNNVHQFQTNSVPQVEIGTAFVRFNAGVTLPTIYQTTVTSSNTAGQTLSIQAQNGGPGTSAGGILSLTSGAGTPGTGTGVHGTLDLSTGGTLKMRIFPTVANPTSDNNSILYLENLFRVDSAQATPRFRQDDTASTPGQTYTIQAQNSTNVAGTGGALNLTSGTGVTTSGRVNIQTGGTTQILVSPTAIPPGTSSGLQTSGSVLILGNLEVVGTTTTVDSTIVDIIGHVIHANWSDPSVNPNVAVPNSDVGYSVHRGNVSNVPRDGAAWIWTEGALTTGADGYWRSVTIPGDGVGTDNFNISNSLNIVGVMGNDFSASSDPNPVPGYLAASGSLRTTNNVPVAVSRNITASTTVSAASNLVDLVTAPGTINVVNTASFTTSGTLLVLSSTGVQTVTYTGTTGTSFTGVVGGTGIIITGSIVGQTNKSTTFNGVNGTSLSQNSITVVSTLGFPPSGVLRVVSHTSNNSAAPPSVQTLTYTSKTGTTFDNGSGLGGTGFLFVGDAVTSVPPTGNQDLVLLGTDFGNRILYGAPTSNTGHIFNTPAGFFYDFQTSSVSQVQLGKGDVDVSGFAETISIGPTVVNPRIIQPAQPDTGANNGYHLGIKAQNGQQQTGATTNNNGGSLVLSSGTAGTGGSGTIGIDGYVDIYTGNTLKTRIFPTDANPAGPSADDNSILYFESLFRVDSAQIGAGLIPGTGVRFRQDDTANALGQVYTIQAQNATSTGGPLVLQSGTGAINDGYINLDTGNTVKMTIFPTTAVSAANNNSILVFENKFRFDTAQLTPLIRQDDRTTAAGTGETFTIQAQNETGTTSTGGALNLVGGSGTSTGGSVNLISGSGTGLTNGVVNVQIAGTQTIAFNKDDVDASGFAELMGIASTIVNPRIYQVATGGATGTILALMAQSAATTGGPLQLHSGSGATNDGYINLTTGTPGISQGAVKMTIFPTTATVAANNNSILVFENKFRFDTAQVTPLIRQDDKTTAAGTGEAFTVQAQNETGTTSTGGALVLTSGTGTTVAGNTQIQTGGVDRVVVHPTFTEFRDTAEALRVTPVSAGTTSVQFASTVLASRIFQADLATNGGIGATLTVQAQNETGTTSFGGDLSLTSGTGTTADGYTNLQAGGSTVARVHTNKFIFSKGWRRHITPISSGATYTVLASDDYIAITTLSAPFQINLPTAPVLGDTYEFKDATGNAGTQTVTISGNAAYNIDGATSIVLNQAYASATVTFTGSEWSVT